MWYHVLTYECERLALRISFFVSIFTAKFSAEVGTWMPLLVVVTVLSSKQGYSRVKLQGDVLSVFLSKQTETIWELLTF